MRKFQMLFGTLVLGVLSIMAAQAASAETFDDRLCVPMPAIAQAVAQHASEGTYTEVEHVGEGTLHVLIGHTMTVWQNMEGTLLWCMQEHLGGQGA